MFIMKHFKRKPLSNQMQERYQELLDKEKTGGLDIEEQQQLYRIRQSRRS